MCSERWSAEKSILSPGKGPKSEQCRWPPVPDAMERFAINILHKQIYKICRLCGVDQPSKVPILEETEIEIIVGDEEEATLAKKILDCVGIEVRGPPALIALFFSLSIAFYYCLRLMSWALIVLVWFLGSSISGAVLFR